MSDTNAIGLISAIFLACYAVFIFADRWIHERGAAIATGFDHGAPVTVEHRWLVLTNSWFTLSFSMVVTALIVTAAFVGIARDIGDPFVQSLAYGCSVATGGTSLFYIVMGGSWFLHYRRILRQAEAD